MRSSALLARPTIAGVAVSWASALAVACGSSPAPDPATTDSATTASAPAATHSPAATATAAQSPQPCPLSALRVTLGGWNGAAAGTSYRSLDFANSSATTCTLLGYPGVSFVSTPGGAEVGAAASRIVGGKQLVLLVPHATAQATLGLVDVLNFEPQACHLRTAHWLRIYAPGQVTAGYVGWTARVCSGSKPVFLLVGPVQPGTDTSLARGHLDSRVLRLMRELRKDQAEGRQEQ
jgi:Protein of unknown function (DUF4232)